MPAILFTEATRRTIDRGFKKDVDLRLLVGKPKKAFSTIRLPAEVTGRDTFFPEFLGHRCTGVEAAFSLVPCMGNNVIFRRQDPPSQSTPWTRWTDLRLCRFIPAHSYFPSLCTKIIERAAEST